MSAPRQPAARAASPFILGPLGDWLLFIGTPALIIPAVLLAQSRFSSDQIYLFVASFGAVGHHLPGLMRAYGDRALFARFRWRFVLAPVILLATCVTMAFVARPALLLVVLAWATWHGAMQVHGFARIYDAKVGSTAATTARLDQALALSWFWAVLLWSPVRIHYIVDNALKAGLPVLAPGTWRTAQILAFAVTGAATTAWLAWTARQWRRGSAPSLLKLALLGSSVGFFAYANVAVEDLLIAVVLFELFHDAQYLTIVWIFNRRRADTDPAAGAFTRSLFRPRLFLVGAYVAACFAYGGLNFVQSLLPPDALSTTLAGVLAASGFLHFYYDGFIWKLREAGTREGLGIGGGAVAPRPLAPLAHGLKWVVLWVLPLSLLLVASSHAIPERERMIALARALPGDAGAQRNAAIALRESGDLGGALAAARRARELLASADPQTRGHVEATLATLLSESAVAHAIGGRKGEATVALREALALDPKSCDRLVDEAANRVEARQPRPAQSLCEVVLVVAPEAGHAHYNLAVALAAQGRLPEAAGHAEDAARLLPDVPQARQVLERIRAGIAAGVTPGATTSSPG